MAFDYFQSEDEKEKESGGVTGTSQTLGQESPIVTGNTPQQATAQKGTSSGSFTNLQKYLDANKDSGMGQRVIGDVDNTIKDAETQQQTAGEEFKKRASSGAAQSNMYLNNLVTTNPNEVLKNAEQTNQVKALKNAQYTGPNSFADVSDLYQPTQQKTQYAQQVASGTATPEGRSTFLRDQYGTKAGRYDYTQGQQKLDSFLLAGDPNTKQAFEGFQQRGQALGNNFNALNDTLSQYASGKAQETADARAQMRQALGIDENNQAVQGGNIQGAYQAAQDRMSSAQKQADDYRSNLLQAYGQGNLQKLFPHDDGTKRLAENAWAERLDMDFSPGSYAGKKARELTGDFSKYLSSKPFTIDQVATPEEQQRIAALSALADIENTFLPNAQAAGTFNPADAVSIDLERLFRDRADATESINKSRVKTPGDGGWNSLPQPKIAIDAKKKNVEQAAQKKIQAEKAAEKAYRDKTWSLDWMKPNR